MSSIPSICERDSNSLLASADDGLLLLTPLKRKLDPLVHSPPSDSDATQRPKRPRIEIQIPLFVETEGTPRSGASYYSFLSLSDEETNSLFDEAEGEAGAEGDLSASGSALALAEEPAAFALVPAMRTAPPIPGLYIDAGLRVPEDLAKSVFDCCMERYFRTPGVNQVMLFNRYSDADDADAAISLSSSSSSTSISTSTDRDPTPTGFPAPIQTLISALSVLLKPTLPAATYDLLFPARPTMARQAIINLYQPGEGITPHVDLLRRYGDGIMGVSFGSGCVMRFDEVKDGEKEGKERESISTSTSMSRWDLFLPERSVVVLSEDARYKWTHGIEKRTRDLVVPPPSVEGGSLDGSASPTLVERGVRVSVTLRWLLPGADVVGN